LQVAGYLMEILGTQTSIRMRLSIAIFFAPVSMVLIFLLAVSVPLCSMVGWWMVQVSACTLSNNPSSSLLLSLSFLSPYSFASSPCLFFDLQPPDLFLIPLSFFTTVYINTRVYKIKGYVTLNSSQAISIVSTLNNPLHKQAYLYIGPMNCNLSIHDYSRFLHLVREKVPVAHFQNVTRTVNS